MNVFSVAWDTGCIPLSHLDKILNVSVIEVVTGTVGEVSSLSIVQVSMVPPARGGADVASGKIYLLRVLNSQVNNALKYSS